MISWFLLISRLTPLTTQVAIVVCWLLCVGLLAESVNRFTTAGPEIVRKIVHIGTGNVILLAWLLNIPLWVGVSASIVFSAITLLSYFVPILPSINGIGRKSLGTFFYTVSIGILVAWFWSLQLPQFAAIGILVMTWGDGFAAVIGQRYGKHPYKLWDMKKSWEGSIAMGLISLAVTLLILFFVYGHTWQIWLIAGITASLATALEAFSKFGIDNLTVPISSAAVCFWLSQILLV